jgi:hypothetical protein
MAGREMNAAMISTAHFSGGLTLTVFLAACAMESFLLCTADGSAATGAARTSALDIMCSGCVIHDISVAHPDEMSLARNSYGGYPLH